ncbi:MAG: UbiD family decarboxylase [Pirellulaceae bacterium]|nr:UbiD family decarboxylase [Pirellulaceae bacterium]
MGYRSLDQCVRDLEAAGHLVRVEEPIDACLEAAEIQRRVYRSQGPAVLLANVKGCRFPMVSNLFGSLERARFLFRDTLDQVRRLIELKIEPERFARQPLRYWRAPLAAWSMQPRSSRRGPVLAHRTTIGQLPQLRSWPDDGGAFITLPQVYTEHPARPGARQSNLGMYRVQLSGGQYQPDREIGLHYQIHRGIGVHHQAAIARGEPLRVSVFVGGSPAMTLAAVMPLPEGLSELTFAGALAGHRIPLIRRPDGSVLYGDADFCITGTVDPDRKLPEGPFGDHLGYYSLAHEFPVLRVEQVYYRERAIWPFTVVGRPPQEDTTFGQLIHELTGPVIPTVIPGVRAVNAVDAAGVHPLLLAIGSERYMPFHDAPRPQELLTQAHAILGQGQMSLAKYLMIVNGDDDPGLNVDQIEAFFGHLLRRIDWRRDLHFQTRTTIDTLDYSGSGLNEGSKVVLAAVGPPRRELPVELPAALRLPDGFRQPRVCLPGVLAVEGPAARHQPHEVNPDLARFCAGFSSEDPINGFPLVVLVDDSDFTQRSVNNFLWVVFTRSNPAADLDGIEASVCQKHWGCRGSLVIDARIKPQHAPPLIEDPRVTAHIDALAARGGPLARYL